MKIALINDYIMFFIFLSLFACVETDSIENEETIQNNIDICDQLYPPADTIIVTHTNFTKTHYTKRIKTFKSDTIKEGDIVMLGNSLTEQGGNWNFLLSMPNVKNRGISGDNTDGIMARLNELICMKPSFVLIMIGTNDLFTQYTADKIAGNIDSIGTLLSTEIPDARVIVQTIMPLGKGNDKKDKLLAINAALKKMDSISYQLLDTYLHMANIEGDLPETLTYDGIHLTPAGYEKWTELLMSQING